MLSEDTPEVFAIPYKTRDNAFIVVTRISEPYGPGSEPVISVGCTLKGDVKNPTWKVHIPQDLINDVLMAVNFSMEDAGGTQ